MLVEFRVKNFRSIRDEQVFSLVATSDKTLKDTHTIQTDISSVPAILRSSAIYGANASGKTNLIKAMQFMKALVAESATMIKPGQSFTLKPFLLDAETASEPSSFEMTFISENIRYQYGFSLTAHRIIKEYLLVYKTFKPQNWFERNFDAKSGKDIYEFGTGLKGPKNVWENATRDNALFLSMAVQLNSEPLKPVFNWLVNDLIIFNERTPLLPHFTLQMLNQPEGKKSILDFINQADISLADIQVNKKKVPTQMLHFDAKEGKTEIRQQEVENNELLFHHKTEEGSAVFEFMDESHGTRNLLILSGPIIDIIKNGRTLIVDELESGLHPLLLKELVNLFHQPSAKTNAQLIFTTHNTNLLDAPGVFRRDQIWLVEKDEAQATHFISLAEFSPRKNEAKENGYLSGRYGAVPFLKEWQIIK
jgi:AAA15 family ATPase/GTPase